jgi:hypothetical protein
LNNQNTVKFSDDSLSDEERTNLRMRQNLIDLNQSLFFSESLDDISLIIPFDTVKIGSGLKDYFKNYKPDLLFHQSGLQTLVPISVNNAL